MNQFNINANVKVHVNVAQDWALANINVHVCAYVSKNNGFRGFPKSQNPNISQNALDWPKIILIPICGHQLTI